MQPKATYVWICALFLMFACSQENDSVTVENPSTENASDLKFEIPLRSNDLTHHGI